MEKYPSFIFKKKNILFKLKKYLQNKVFILNINILLIISKKLLLNNFTIKKKNKKKNYF